MTLEQYLTYYTTSVEMNKEHNNCSFYETFIIYNSLLRLVY